MPVATFAMFGELGKLSIYSETKIPFRREVIGPILPWCVFDSDHEKILVTSKFLV